MAATAALAGTVAVAQPRANPAGPDQFICGTATAMQADPLSGGDLGFWSVVQGTGSFVAPGSPNSPVTGLSFGENVFRWTIFASSGQSSDLVSVWCYDSAMPLANAGPDQTVAHWPGTTQLNGSTPTAPGACFWSVVSGICAIADPTDPQSQVYGLGTGPTVLQWSCDNGPCGTSSDEMVIDAVVGIGEHSLQTASIRHDAARGVIVYQANLAVQLMLRDALGRRISSASVGAGEGVWELGELPAGWYVAAARTEESESTIRFVVQR